QRSDCALTGCRLGDAAQVENDLVAFLPRVDRVVHVARVGFEPPDLVGGAVPRNDTEAGGQRVVEHDLVATLAGGHRIGDEGQVHQDRVVLGGGHVVRQAGSGQLDVGEVGDRTRRAHDAVAHVRPHWAVVEEQQ